MTMQTNADRQTDATLLGHGEKGAQRVPVNTYETSDAYVIVAPMPGVAPSDVEVRVDGTTVTLRAELRTAAPKEYILHEWEYGLYERSLEIEGSYRGPVTAVLGNGQLAVSISREGARVPGELAIVQPNTHDRGTAA